MHRTSTSILVTVFLAAAQTGASSESSWSQASARKESATTMHASSSVAPDLRLRIGVVTPSVVLGGASDAEGTPEGVRRQFMMHVAQTAFDVLAIEATVPADVRLEARREGIDYLVSMTLAQGSDSSAPTAVPSASGELTARNSVTIAYALAKGDGAVAYEGRLEADAEGDGEDVIGPLLERAADEIVEIVRTGRFPAKAEPSVSVAGRLIGEPR